MRLKETLKKNTALRMAVKSAKIHREFSCDAKSFSRNYLEAAEYRGNHAYRVMLLVHRLEKGMCMQNPRPFGQQKADELVSILSGGQNPQSFEYKLGCAALQSWSDYINNHQWQDKIDCQRVCAFLKQCGSTSLQAGRLNFHAPNASEKSSFDDVIFSRRSVRDYQDRELEKEDVAYALECFRSAPTACNRQMCKVYQIIGSKEKDILDKTIIGISGFNKCTTHYFVIIFDLTAFEYSGERNQGYFNAGLTAMNFINGLHARGIGSCCLQWSNPAEEDAMVRKALKLPESERIAVVIGAGYYLETSLIPYSCRKKTEDIFQVVGEA